jgi:hypothetical protein
MVERDVVECVEARARMSKVGAEGVGVVAAVKGLERM